MDLEDWEHVTCLKTVSLEYEGHASGLKDYLAVSTNYNYGEDIISRGRIFILDLIEVVPEPGQPLTKNKIKTLYAKDQKGAVAAISSVSGYLVAAIGQKVCFVLFQFTPFNHICVPHHILFKKLSIKLLLIKPCKGSVFVLFFFSCQDLVGKLPGCLSSVLLNRSIII